MKSVSLYFRDHIKDVGLLFILVCAVMFPKSAGATPNVYTWTDQTASGVRWWKGIAGSSDLSELAAVDLQGGNIYTSADSGATWTLQSNAGTHSWVSIASSPDGTKLAAISNITGNVYVSFNSGVNWTVAAGAGTRNWTAITSASSSAVIAATAYGGDIYISTTTGSTWTAATNAGSQNWQAITSSADGTKIAAAVNPGNIYLSTDGGMTWTISSATSTTWQAITSSSDGNKLAAAANNGYIYTSMDGGVTWATSTAPSAAWQSITSSSDGTRIVAAVSNGDIYVSPDSGATWVDQTSLGSKNWFSVVSSSDGSKLAATEYNGDIWTASLDVTPPTITLDPNFNNIHLGPNATHFNAEADDDQAVSSVQFYVNNVAFGSPLTSPIIDNLYAIAFDPSVEPEGTYSLLAVAKDSTGNYATSTAETYYVIHTPASIVQVTQIPSTITDSSATYYYSASFSNANANSQALILSTCGNNSQRQAGPISNGSGNSITIGNLEVGDTYQCTFFLRDAASNESNTLTIGPFTRIAAIVSSPTTQASSGGVVWGCKDPSATNYNYFSASNPSLCRYQNSSTTAVDVVRASSSPHISSPVHTSTTSLALSTDLETGASGQDVVVLQHYLISMNIGPAAQNLSEVGATGFYGQLTRLAVKELQAYAGITPVNGRAGPKTRAYLASDHH